MPVLLAFIFRSLALFAAASARAPAAGLGAGAEAAVPASVSPSASVSVAACAAALGALALPRESRTLARGAVISQRLRIKWVRLCSQRGFAFHGGLRLRNLALSLLPLLLGLQLLLLLLELLLLLPLQLALLQELRDVRQRVLWTARLEKRGPDGLHERLVENVQKHLLHGLVQDLRHGATDAQWRDTCLDAHARELVDEVRDREHVVPPLVEGREEDLAVDRRIVVQLPQTSLPLVAVKAAISGWVEHLERKLHGAASAAQEGFEVRDSLKHAPVGLRRCQLRTRHPRARLRAGRPRPAVQRPRHAARGLGARGPAADGGAWAAAG
mmetsp:Transcript_147322/g.473337  ORF Transcript_147322/g.473337 Transcript_147322/m.473337 type:complete len:327 (-) Transcript_147322:2752-3732(-)